MQANDAPVVVWGITDSHVCLGQHQSLALEINRDINVPVLRRPLGGGGVWLDEHQVCVVFVAPRNWLPSRPSDWYAQALAPLLQVYRDAGMPVKLNEQDVALHGAKIAGSGAATIAQAGLVGSSFVLQFPAAAFAAAVAAPSEGFRVWLEQALRQNMTCWAEHAEVPNIDWLSMCYRRAAAMEYGWRWKQDVLRDDEREAGETWREELQPDQLPTRKLVPYGIKVRAGCYLTERKWDDQQIRVLTKDGTIERLYLDNHPELPESVLAASGACASLIDERLSAWCSAEQAQMYSSRILATAWFGEDNATR